MNIQDYNQLPRMTVPPYQFTAEELQELLRPIASLISKSEKAQKKLNPGTWQHTMLQANLGALRIALELMDKRLDVSAPLNRKHLEEASDALASMMAKTTNAQGKFTVGTAQHSLLRNRLKALHVAAALVKAELESAR